MKDNWYQIRTQQEIGHLGFATTASEHTDIPLPLPYKVLRSFLRLTGLYGRGHGNFLKVRLNDYTHALNAWPEKSPSLEVLQISDLHLDLDPDLAEVLVAMAPKCSADLCVFTGDFWEGGFADHGAALRDLARLLQALPDHPLGRFAVLGNHDAAALVPILADLGIQVLVNSAVTLEVGDQAFALAGIDDAYHFKTHDLRAAREACPPGIPSILLSHSPQVALEASRLGFHFMVSGHTHGGQVCFPWGQPIVNMADIPKSVFVGPWQVNHLKGYTSQGTGTCHLPVRFNCPPEIARHKITSSGD